MKQLEDIHGEGRKLSSGNLSTSSSSSMEFKSSTCSSSSSSVTSIPSQFSSTSSIDSALIWLYTSCEFKNFPYKSLFSANTSSAVSSLCLANNLLIAGTTSTGIQVFDLNKELQLDHSRSSSAAGSVKALLSAEGHVFSCHQDGSIKLWSPGQGDLKRKGSLPTKTDMLARCLIPANYVKVRRHRNVLWIRHADAVSCMASAGGFIYSGSWDKTLKIWRAADLRCLQSVKAHDDAVNAIAAQEQFVYTAGADGKIKAWEVSSSSESLKLKKKRTKTSLLTLVAILERHSSSVNALALDATSGYLYSASSDKTIGVWEREETAMHMAAVDSLRGHCMAVLSLALCYVPGDKDGHGPTFLLCSGSADKTVRVWSRERVSGVHSCLCVIKGHQGPVKSVGISSGGTLRDGGALVWSGGLDSHVKTWLVSLDGSEESVEDSKRAESLTLMREHRGSRGVELDLEEL